MHLANYFKRGELARFSSESIGNQVQRFRRVRDPFEGDPFKIQSLNFHYADKPLFYPVISRIKEQSIPDKVAEVKKIYYNHDHSIPKRNKENIQIRGCQSTTSSHAPKSMFPKRSTSGISSLSSKLAANSVESNLALKKSCARTFITQPSNFHLNHARCYAPTATSSMKRSLKPSNISMASAKPQSLKSVGSGINFPNAYSHSHVHPSGCQITIKINGVPKNRVQIRRSEGNIEINLAKMKKPKKLQSPKAAQRFRLKPSRSYIINKKEPATAEVRHQAKRAKYPQPVTESSTSSNPSQSLEVRREASTHSMIPHREEPSATENNNSSKLWGETYRTNSRMAINAAVENIQNSRESGKVLGTQATLLERILSHNPITLHPAKEPNSTTRLHSAEGSMSNLLSYMVRKRD